MSTMTDSAIQSLFSHWQSSDYKAGIVVSGVAGLLIMISAALVYSTGGTQHSYVHVVYVPILIGAFFFGPLGGFLTGLLSGLVMGPMMPLDATVGTNQDPLNYLSRTAAFSMIGAVAGVMFVTIGRYLKIMRSQAFADPVTGLPNRAKLLADVSDLQRHLAAAPTKDDTPQPTQILTIRVEPYSRVMAILGPDCADAMLRSVVGRLESKADGAWKFYDLREGVLAVIIRTPSTDDAVKYVYRLSGALREPVSAKGIPILAECRFGVASLNPGSGAGAGFGAGSGTGVGAGASDPVRAVRASLAALEDARERRSFVAVYDTDRDDRRRQTVSLLADIQEALASNDQLQLYLQPKIDLETQHCNGFEALLRWRHPERGMIPPDVFIPVVEQTGLMKQLTEWVVKAALAQSDHWCRQGIDLPIAVNISAHDLERPGFAGWLGGQFREFGVEPDKLEIEVTESAVMSDPDGALRTLAALRGMGVKVALDDFGTGQSSLAYLKDMAVDIVKLDRSLIRDINDDPRSHALVKAVMGLSDSFGLAVVAEGIEDSAECRTLADLGCRTGQGYFFAKPMPSGAAARWLSAAPST